MLFLPLAMIAGKPQGVRRSICALVYKHSTPDGLRRCVGLSAINMALLTECGAALGSRL